MTGQIRSGKAKGEWYLRVEMPRDPSGKRQRHREKFVGKNKDALNRLRVLVGAAEVLQRDGVRLPEGIGFTDFVMEHQRQPTQNAQQVIDATGVGLAVLPPALSSAVETGEN